MDRRSWPWKKKSSDKTVSTPDHTVGSTNGTTANQDSQENFKNTTVSYVQLSQERYAHLSEMEDQVKVLNEQLSIAQSELSTAQSELSTAQSELSTKETSIKQHTKVAEEAVSGWEKAEAEALALKTQLESVTLLKLSVESRAVHLDGALKECMMEIRYVKEEGEQKLRDVIFTKTKQWEQVQYEFEAKINALEQELLKSSSDISALSRSLQERSNTLMKISEEKSNADADIEILKTNIQSLERELTSMKYEVHIVSKELEIRNEEKNMSVRSAEVANKQHLEDVKKITKLEAECQRLRGLVRKKLPGPAALAQMKQEVEGFGRDNGDSRLRRSPAKSSNSHFHSVPDHTLEVENIQQTQKENEFLTGRLLAMEEETKMLKEALSKRNSELQASRSMFAKTAGKLRTLEAQVQVPGHQKNLSKANTDIHMEGSLSQNGSNPPSLTSMSEDGIDEEASCSESWGTGLISELSHFKKEKDNDKASRAGSSGNMELMDDFLEMEKLASLSAESGGPVVLGGDLEETRSATAKSIQSVDGQKEVDFHEEKIYDISSSTNMASLDGAESNLNEVSPSKLQSELASVFDGKLKGANIEKLLEDIKHIVHRTEEKLPQHSVSCVAVDVQVANDLCDQGQCGEDRNDTKSIDGKSQITEDLKMAVYKIRESILSFINYSNSNAISQKVEELSSVVDKVLCNDSSVDELVISLSSFLCEICQLSAKTFCEDNEREVNSPDCIDKVALPENKVDQQLTGKNQQFSDFSSDSDILRSGTDFEMKGTLARCSQEEFEQLKLEKESLATDLASCTETLEVTKSQLLETEHLLADLKSQLAAVQKSNSLTETQLKCMAESYRFLELRANELEEENRMLKPKIETLVNELREERTAHQECSDKYKDLQEQMESTGKQSQDDVLSMADADIKAKQEMEMAAAAEKLAECQETIFLLGKQLKSLHPQPDFRVSSPNYQNRMSDSISEDSLSSTRGSNLQCGSGLQLQENAENQSARSGGESPFEGHSYYNSSNSSGQIPKSPINSKLPKNSSSRSSNSSDEKHGRGLGRFFSKGK